MDDLPIRIIINQISVGEAEKLSERAYKARDLWTKATQNCYHLKPVQSESIKRGLFGAEIKVGGDLDYAATIKT